VQNAANVPAGTFEMLLGHLSTRNRLNVPTGTLAATEPQSGAKECPVFLLEHCGDRVFRAEHFLF
jgi:hypothetical protein